MKAEVVVFSLAFKVRGSQDTQMLAKTARWRRGSVSIENGGREGWGYPRRSQGEGRRRDVCGEGRLNNCFRAQIPKDSFEAIF